MKIKSVKKITGVFNEFQGYLMTFEDSNLHKSVPVDEANTDYQTILKWVEEGNTIEEAD